MTIVNGVEIGPIIINETRQTIQNNDPIDDTLHVVIVISNPCNYKRRYQLAREFIDRFESEGPHVKLYVVELVYGPDQKFRVTRSDDPSHLQLRTNSPPLWHKENLINIGVRKLIPETWKAMAWIDADIEFESPTWALDTLKILNGSKDVVQLFSHAVDMDHKNETMNIFEGFGYKYSKRCTRGNDGVWHPGFAWAMNRKAWDRLGGLYELSILGAGDHNMSLSFLGKGILSVNQGTTPGYKKSVLEFEKKARGLRLGYVPGVIRHFFHGQKKNRRYCERWQILVKNAYDPAVHVTLDPVTGLLVPTGECPPELIRQIMEYFQARNEDEFFS